MEIAVLPEPAGSAPLIAAPLFAIALGVVIANPARSVPRAKALEIGQISKLWLKGGVALLGVDLDLGAIDHTRLDSLSLLVVTKASTRRDW